MADFQQAVDNFQKDTGIDLRGFDGRQTGEIINGIARGDSEDQVLVYANRNLDADQMAEIKLGIDHGLSLEDIELMATSHEAAIDYDGEPGPLITMREMLETGVSPQDVRDHIEDESGPLSAVSYWLRSYSEFAENVADGSDRLCNTADGKVVDIQIREYPESNDSDGASAHEFSISVVPIYHRGLPLKEAPMEILHAYDPEEAEDMTEDLMVDWGSADIGESFKESYEESYEGEFRALPDLYSGSSDSLEKIIGIDLIKTEKDKVDNEENDRQSDANGADYEDPFESDESDEDDTERDEEDYRFFHDYEYDYDDDDGWDDVG